MLFSGKHLILVVILISLVYANSLFNGFVYDDFNVIANNDFVKSFQNLPLVFSKKYLTPPGELSFDLKPYSLHSGETTYRPVATLSYFLDYALFRMNPWGYRLTNILLHISCALLVYLLLNILFSQPALSLFSSLLFAIHPVNVEVLNCTAFRPNSLAFFFVLCSIILYFKFQAALENRFRAAFFIASLGSSLLALFSKEIAVLLPLALILCEYYRLDFDARRLWANRSYFGLYLLVALCYLLVYFFLMPPAQGIFMAPAITTVGHNLLRTLDILWIYLRAILLPQESVFIPPMAIPKSYSGALFGGLAVLISIYILAKRRQYPKEISFGMLWFFLWLIPMNNFLNTFRIPLAYRYLYLPLAGVSVVLGWFLAKIKMVVLRSALVTGYLGMFFIFTLSSNAYWKNEMLLYLYLVDKYPHSLPAHISLGRAFSIYGNYPEAIEEFNYVLWRHFQDKEPLLGKYDLANTYYNLALCHQQKAQYHKAIEAYLEALKAFPDDPKLYVALGICYANTGAYAQARRQFVQAKDINPEYPRADEELLKVLKMKGED